MYKFLVKNRGSVTVLLSILLIPILSLSSLMIEIGRMYSAKESLKEIENSSIVSLLAEYNDVLDSEFGILGTYINDPDKAKAEFTEYLKYNSANIGDSSNSLSSMYNIVDDGIELTGTYNLGSPEILQHSIIECQKYSGVYNILNDYLDIDSFIDNLLKQLIPDGFLDQLNKLVGFFDKIADIVELVDDIANLKQNGTDIATKCGELKETFEKLTSAMDAIDAANQKIADIEAKNGGSAPKAPSSTSKDKANAYYKILDEINNMTGEDSWDEDLKKEFPSSLDSYAKTYGFEVKYSNGDRKTIGDFLPSSVKNKGDLEKKVSSAENSYNTAKSNYEEAEKKFEKDNKDYSDAVAALNSAKEDLGNALTALASGLESVNTEIKNYSDQVKTVIDQFNKVRGDYKTDDNEEVNDCFKKLDAAASSVSGISQSISKLVNDIKSFTVDTAVSTIKNKIKSVLGDLTADALKNYIFNTTAGILAAEVIGQIENILDDISTWISFAKNLFKVAGKLVDVLKPFPNYKNGDLDVVMSDANMNITLSKNASVNTNPFMAQDAMFINNRINKRNAIARNYGFSELKNASASSVANNENDIGLIGLLIDIGQSLYDFVKTFSDVFSGGLIRTIYRAVKGDFGSLIENGKKLYSSIVDLVSNLSTLIKQILQTAYANIILTNYAEIHFSNRITEAENPQDAVYQLFKKCEEEYIISGSSKEETNQRNVSLAIFMYRILNNLVAVAADEDAMKLISSCYVFAPLVYILWVYWESCIDINLLVNGATISLFKNNLWISVDTLKSLAENVDKLTEDDLKEPSKVINVLFTGNGGGENNKDLGKGFNYKNYLTFMMLFVSNKTKSARIGDLIQWHVRNTQKNDFRLNKTYTTFRADVKATLNPILPIMNLGQSYDTGVGLTNKTKIEQVWYEGY